MKDNEEEYISISQYATEKGISPQAVYKKLNTTLKPYVVIVDGKKKLKKESLNDFKPSLTTVDNQTLNQVEQPLNNPDSDKTVDKLLEMLSRKDDDIEALQERIKDLENHIMQQSTELVEVLKKNQDLQEQVHQLVALPQIKELQQATENNNQVEQPLNQNFKPFNNRLTTLLNRFKRK